MPKKIVEEAIAEVTSEANEVAGTITLKRWQVAVIAAVISTLTLIVIL